MIATTGARGGGGAACVVWRSREEDQKGCCLVMMTRVGRLDCLARRLLLKDDGDHACCTHKKGRRLCTVVCVWWV